MQNDILFDNIYIGHSVKDADALKKETFDVKVKVEKAEEEASKPKKDEKKKEKPKSPMDLAFMDDPVLYIKEKFDLFIALAQRDPVQAIKFVPEIAGGIAVVVVTALALLIGAIGGGAAAAPSKEQVKAKTEQVKEKAKDVAESVSSSAQAAASEAKQRTTRSSAQ